jgi:hypothetical protein
MRPVTSLLALVILATFSSSASNAYASEVEKEILKTVGDFAERICAPVPLEGSSSAVELSGSAKVDLGRLLKKMKALGIQGAAKYQESQWQGLLQKDLRAAMRDSNDCKLNVVNTLLGKLLSASVPASPRVPDSVRKELSRLALEGSTLRDKWFSHVRANGGTEPPSGNDILAWHKRVEDYLAKPSLGLTYVARFKNQTRSNGSYPILMGKRSELDWDLLLSDLERLDEFIKER